MLAAFMFAALAAAAFMFAALAAAAFMFAALAVAAFMNAALVVTALAKVVLASSVIGVVMAMICSFSFPAADCISLKAVCTNKAISIHGFRKTFMFFPADIH